MIRVGGFRSGIPLRVLGLLGAVAVLLSVMGFVSATEQANEAHQCRVDWESAIAARQQGASEYSGSCASFGGFQGDDVEVPDEFYANLAEWDRRLSQELADLGQDPWQVAATSIAGIPMVAFAVLLGSLSTGTQLGNGTAAWCIANGWTRGSWAGSAMVFTTAVVAFGYVVIATGFVTSLARQLDNLGATVALTPNESLILPVSGLAFYGVIGVACGIFFKRAESAAMAALVVVLIDLLLSRSVVAVDFIPATLHSISMGLAEANTSAAMASISLLVAAAVVAFWTLRRFILVVDVPDRPV